MDARKLIEKLSHHVIVNSEMSLHIQLGLPFLEKKNNRLCISFKPHKEIAEASVIKFYFPQYTISWVYPFHHVISFENLNYQEMADYSSPSAELSVEFVTGSGKYLLNELYSECGRVLTFYEKDGDVSEIMLKKYQKMYYEIVEMLQLTNIYGEENKDD